MLATHEPEYIYQTLTYPNELSGPKVSCCFEVLLCQAQNI